MLSNDIKFCVATSFEDELVKYTSLVNKKSKNKVFEFFGSMKSVLTGTGRPSKILQDISFSQLQKHVELCHNNNIQFNYTLNGACMGAKEFDNEYLKRVLDFINDLVKIKIDTFTFTNPYLITVVRNKFPRMNICLSIIAGVNSVQEIEIYNNLSIDRLVLDANINRNFSLLEHIRKVASLELEVLANNPCLFKCPFRRYHPEIDSHISMEEKEVPAFPSVLCKKIRLKNIEEIIKSPWIRPSDSHFYSEIGIDFIKLGGRGKNTKWLKSMIEHYVNEKDGDNFYQFIEKNGWEYFRERNHNLSDLQVTIPSLPSNFLLHFRNKRYACDIDCRNCLYCNKIAEKYIKINSLAVRREYLKTIDKIIKNVTNPL